MVWYKWWNYNYNSFFRVCSDNEEIELIVLGLWRLCFYDISFSWALTKNTMFKKKKIHKVPPFQNNVQSNVFAPCKLLCHKTVVGNYGFTF